MDKTEGECPVRNLSNDDTINTTNQNTIMWKGQLGQGFEVRVQRWHTNEKVYINFRKNGNVGANVPIELYSNVCQALLFMKKDVPEAFN